MMKLSSLLLTRTSSIVSSECRLLRSISFSGGLTCDYSTAAAAASVSQKKSWNSPHKESLYRRLSPAGNPNESVVPILDQWIEEGRQLLPGELRAVIRELRRYGRLKHALEISQWMTDKRYMKLTVTDVATRLFLIAAVHGVEQAENYFNNTPKQLKTLEVHGALLNCYSHKKCVEKAEALMQRMRELGFAISAVNYNALLRLYHKTGEHEKVDMLIHEMEVRKINFDSYTYSILLNIYGANSDIDGMEKLLTKMESDAELNVDWNVYATAANEYLRAGCEEKALVSLRKSEKLIAFAKKKHEAFSYILTIYATAGKKEEVLRVWEVCKSYKAFNRDYIAILSSILKLNDIETAEKIFSEWQASDLTKDIRIPNFFFSLYCKSGLMEKAEALLERVKMENWEKPNLFTYYWMSLGYVQKNQMLKAVQAMESALLKSYQRGGWMPDSEPLVACLKYLKEEGDTVRLGEFVNLLKEKGKIPVEVHDRFPEYFSDENAVENAFQRNSLGDHSEHLDTQNVVSN